MVLLSNEIKVFFDEEKCLEEIRGHYEWCLEQLGNILLGIMQREVMKTVDGKTPGKKEWREETQKKLKIVSKEITDKYISVSVGVDEDVLLYELMRAMLINSGSGSRRSNAGWRDPIKTKPGEYAWDDNLEYLQMNNSGDSTSRLLPDKFNQTGNEFISNAMRKMKTYSPRYIKALQRRIMESVKHNIYFTGQKG